MADSGCTHSSLKSAPPLQQKHRSASHIAQHTFDLFLALLSEGLQKHLFRKDPRPTFQMVAFHGLFGHNFLRIRATILLLGKPEDNWRRIRTFFFIVSFLTSDMRTPEESITCYRIEDALREMF